MSRIALQKAIKPQTASLALERGEGGDIDKISVYMGSERSMGEVCEREATEWIAATFACAFIASLSASFSALISLMSTLGISNPKIIEKIAKLSQSNNKSISKKLEQIFLSMHSYVLGGKWDIKVLEERIVKIEGKTLTKPCKVLSYS